MTKCSAPNCENSLRRGNLEFSFHEFPQDADLRKLWLANIGRANWTPGRRSTICSAHFEESYLEKKGKHIQLIEGAIPTIFLSGKRKRGTQSPTYSKIKADIQEPINQVLRGGSNNADSSISISTLYEEPQSISMKIEDVSSPPQDCANQTLGIDVKVEAEKSMNELILIDGSYILGNCQLIDSDGPTQTCQSSSVNFQLEEAVEGTENTILKIHQELSKNDSGASENVVLLETTPTDNKPKRVIISEASNISEEGCRGLLNSSDIAASRLCSSLPSMDSEAFAVETPSSHFSPESNFHPKIIQLCSKGSQECSEITNPDILSQTPPILRGFIDLPMYMGSHKYRQISLKQTSLELRWQTGTFLCRLCGVTSDKTMNLFSSEAAEYRILERISSFLHIKIVRSDDLPQSVCSVCLTKLDTCSELIVTSFNTHQFLASVTCRDMDHSSRLPVHFSVADEKSSKSPALKRHILLMEMYHEEGRPIEEYLTAACNDLNSRLHSKGLCKKSPCNLLLAPISDNCSVSEAEQARTAAEALIVKGLIQDAKGKKQHKNSDVWNATLDEDGVYPESCAESFTSQEDLPSADAVEAVEQSPSESEVLPSLDDLTSKQSKIIKARCLKPSRLWHRRQMVFKNMQRSFLWQEQEDGAIRLTCRICKKEFENNSNYQSHLENCSSPLVINSSILSDYKHQENATKTDLETSLKSLINEEKIVRKSSSKKLPCHRYQCSHCSERLQSKLMLKQHLSQHHASVSTKCDGCNFETLNVYEAALHRQTCSQVRKIPEWKCDTCLQSFSSEMKFQEHQATASHSNEVSSWLCDVCGKRYSVAAKLNEHKKCHLPPELKYLHQCSQCPKRYMNMSRLKEHMQRHEEKRFMCKVCGKMFGTKQVLRQHESTHGDPQYLCSLCSRTFFRKSHLLKHMNVHNPLNPRTSRCGPQPHRDGLNRCRECRNVFENDLLEHYKTCHPHIPLHNYVCEICKMENTSYAELFQHQREVHKTGVKDCPFCNKTIDGSTQMKYHLMKHEGMFPYNCPLCNHGYTANSLLQDHMRRKHTGEKPFQCQQCSKCFPTNGALVQHSTVHSLPHQLLPCPVCNQGFKRKAHLDVHLRTHTGEKPYPCPICDRPFRQRPDCVKHVRVIHGEDPSKYRFQFLSTASVNFPQVVSVAEMELVLEGEDLMQTSLESSNMVVS